MNFSRKKVILVLALGVLFSMCKFDVAKADTILKNNVNSKIRSTNIKVNKSINAKNNVNSNRASRGGDYSSSYNKGSVLIDYAKSFLGKPYVWGAEGPHAFDCSGLTLYVYRKMGVNLPHYTGSQAEYGKLVKRNELVQGDLIFFNTTGYLAHVGMYVGNGKFIHASSGGHRVIISDLSGSYYSSRYAKAKRILN
ncbi:C40 family peptidase [Clostridium sp. KNHs214]|uniref:C40 family peptidase n=1 Tax=Clostridium sp. KNHs214 TaxID=1540257 RepID=UPI0005537381|nr:C40 family peptidase [Clostridium sp. KNHs214]